MGEGARDGMEWDRELIKAGLDGRRSHPVTEKKAQLSCWSSMDFMAVGG